MSFVPTHKIYQSDGVTLVYTIEDVIRREPVLSIDVPDYVEHTNLRSAGSIIVSGGNLSYDIEIYARLAASNYTNLMTALTSLKTLIAVNTHYYLKIQTSASTTDDIKVMRLEPIIVDTSKGHLTKYCYYTIKLKADSW